MHFVFGSGVFNKDEMLLEFGFGVLCDFAVSTWMVVMCVLLLLSLLEWGLILLKCFLID